MKKIIPALALLLFIAAIVSCKKGNQSAIIGKWTLTEADTLCTSAASGATIFQTGAPYTASAGYTRFNADGTGYSSILTTIVFADGATVQKGFDEVAGDFTYSVSGSNADIRFKQKNIRFALHYIISFNGDEMVLTKEEQQMVGATLANFRLTLHYKKIN